jgi:hypothetical protein
MSDWKGHVGFGFLFLLPLLFLFYYFHRPINLLILLPVAFIYSQLPDIDTQASKIRWLLTVLGVGIGFLSLLVLHNDQIAIIALGVVIIFWVVTTIKGFKHRQLLHRPITGVFMSLFLLIISVEAAITGFVCFMSHLIIDLKRNRKIYK